MAVTSTPYSPALLGLGLGTINFTGDFRIALLEDTYTPNLSTHDMFEDVDTWEVSASGTAYPAGGELLSEVEFSLDSGNTKAVFSAGPVNFDSLNATFRYAVVYQNNGSAGNSPLVGLIDFGENRTYANEDFQLTFPNGVVTIQQP